MQRRMNIQATSLIILLSILTIILQFTVYYFIESTFLIWGVSSIIAILCCHMLLEMTTTYEACFQYALLTIFVSLVINAISYFGNVQTFLPFTSAMLGIVIVNWLIPLLHCCLRTLLDYGTKLEGFPEFYGCISILFIILYLAAILTGAFIKDAFPWAYPIRYETYNLLPFGIISSLIEDYLYGYVEMSTIIAYLLTRILAFVPYGFYTTLLLRRQPRLLRILSLFLFPFLIEAIQFYALRDLSDIDDLIFAFLGGTLGSVLFYLTNIIFLLISGREFLLKDTDYRFANSRLHF